jgi:hypothetical protein
MGIRVMKTVDINESDLSDALEHMSTAGEQERELQPEDFELSSVGQIRIQDIPDDLSSWPEWRPGELLELSKSERLEVLKSFRGKRFADYASRWTPSTMPPIVIVTLRDGEEGVGDGRGRVSYAIGMGWKTVPAVHLVERRTRFEPNRITKKGAQKIRKIISDIDRVVLSPEPITDIRTVSQKPGRKPKGLWYGLGDEWLSFTEYNMKRLLKKYNYVYTVQPSQNVLYISDLEELIEFTKRYGADYDAFSDQKCPGIGWKAVSKDYDGIEIIPFIYGAGDLPAGEDCVFWYYGWDVASGCIWNPNGVSSLELVLDLSR